MTDTAVPSTARRTRASLSRELILETALRITLEQPTTPLTLSRLGAELAADPTALYRHFRSRDELIRELGDHLFGEAAELIDTSGDWRDSLRAVASAVREVMLRRPALAADLGVRFTGGPNERTGAGIVADVFRRAGFPEAEVLGHTRAFGEFMLAQVVMAASMLAMPPDAQEFELGVARSLYGPSMGDTPYEYEDDVASQIVDIYVAGLEARLARTAPTAGADEIHHERGDR